MTGNPRILVVDDDTLAREITADILRSADCEVLEAADAPQALNLLAGNRFDLVLSDVKLPGMDGVELAANIERVWPNTPVLLTSGEPTQTPPGMRFLAKPCRPDKLIAAVLAAAR